MLRNRFADTWVHGDWCEIEPNGDLNFWFIRGRSDDTINVAGKRVGPAEFESGFGEHSSFKEAIAIAVPDAVKGDVVVLLAVARERGDESEALRVELMARVDRAMGKSLRPKPSTLSMICPRHGISKSCDASPGVGIWV